MSGGIVGMLALVQAADGNTRIAFLLLGLAAFIDSTDGIWARLVGVREVLPGFSGAQVDNAVDVLTFIWVPIFIMGKEGLLPHPAWLVVPILAALYAYGQVNMKTPDNFFLGFPSYWNVVALYMWWLQPSPVWAVAMVLVPGILSFIPTRYLYPSRNFMLWRTSWGLGMLWVLLLAYLILQEEPDRRLIWLSLFYPAYYALLSFWIDFRIRQSGKPERRARGH